MAVAASITGGILFRHATPVFHRDFDGKQLLRRSEVYPARLYPFEELEHIAGLKLLKCLKIKLFASS